jgi:hypothetical protein
MSLSLFEGEVKLIGAEPLHVTTSTLAHGSAARACTTKSADHHTCPASIVWFGNVNPAPRNVLRGMLSNEPSEASIIAASTIGARSDSYSTPLVFICPRPATKPIEVHHTAASPRAVAVVPEEPKEPKEPEEPEEEEDGFTRGVAVNVP